MFKENKYTNWYYQIVNRAKFRKSSDYTESHHIVPKCLGGNDEYENLAELTAREHFICHLLLTKMHDDHRLKFALVMMQRINDRQSRYVIKTSRLFDYIRRCNSEASSIRNKNKQYISGFVMAVSPCGEERRFADVDEIPIGWVRGSLRKGKSNKNKGKVYCYLGDQVRAVDGVENIPEGWTKGNPRANTSAYSSVIGSSWYHNPITNEEIRSCECPAGWVLGSSRKWFNNGVETAQFIIGTQPSGWVVGRLNSFMYAHGEKRRWFNNGIERRRCVEGQQPEGWVLGKEFKKDLRDEY